MGGGSQPALVERRERDYEARWGRWNPRDSGNPPLLLVLRVGTELATAQRARRADELEKTNERKGVDLNERARDGKTEPATAFLI